MNHRNVDVAAYLMLLYFYNQQGNQTVFAELMGTRKLQSSGSGIVQDMTFLTSLQPNSTLEVPNDSIGNIFNSVDSNTDAVADNVMQKVAREMGLLNSAEILLLKDRIMVKDRLDFVALVFKFLALHQIHYS